MELCPAIRSSFFQELALSQPLGLLHSPLLRFLCHQHPSVATSEPRTSFRLNPQSQLLCLSSGFAMKHIGFFVPLVIKVLTSRTAMSTSTVATISDWALAVLLVLDSFFYWLSHLLNELISTIIH